MQATVATSEPDGSGTLLTDEGVPLAYARDALADHVRHLRVGQRVHVELDGETVTALRLWL